MPKTIRTKTARRWIKRNKRNLSKWRMGLIESKRFTAQYFLCSRCAGDIRFRKFKEV